MSDIVKNDEKANLILEYIRGMAEPTWKALIHTDRNKMALEEIDKIRLVKSEEAKKQQYFKIIFSDGESDEFQVIEDANDKLDKGFKGKVVTKYLREKVKIVEEKMEEALF